MLLGLLKLQIKFLSNFQCSALVSLDRELLDFIISLHNRNSIMNTATYLNRMYQFIIHYQNGTARKGTYLLNGELPHIPLNKCIAYGAFIGSIACDSEEYPCVERLQNLMESIHMLESERIANIHSFELCLVGPWDLNCLSEGAFDCSRKLPVHTPIEDEFDFIL